MLPPRFSPSTTTSPRAALVALLLVVAGFLGSRADDDGEGPIPLPVDPGAGFEGILPRPRLPPYLVRDQGTSPMGVRQVFNTPETIMGQSFTPATNVLDWVAFVFQNHPQPGTVPGPGTVRVRLYTSLSSNGELDGLLGESDEVTIGERETAWLVFTFARTLAVTPGTRYFCRVEWVGGIRAGWADVCRMCIPGAEPLDFFPIPSGGRYRT